MLPAAALLLWAAAAIGGFLVVCVVLVVYATVTMGKYEGTEMMNGKTVIVTGATSGIGKVTALELAKRGAKVILACRNVESANETKDWIEKETGNKMVSVRKLDLSSLQSVRTFAAEVLAEEPRLDVLVHNAGMANTFGRKVTEDGLEITMATNHYGPFLLTHLLIDLLKKSAPSRIVVVASSLYVFASVNLENPNPTRSLPAYIYYASKYANILFCNELARRLNGTGVTANCLHPGMIDSGIWRNVPFPLNIPVKVIAKAFFKNPEQGAQTTLYLSCSAEVEGVTGKYFSDCKESTLSHGVTDETKCKKFWEISENIVKLQPNDPKI